MDSSSAAIIHFDIPRGASKREAWAFTADVTVFEAAPLRLS
jgi:hypothetical protein